MDIGMAGVDDYLARFHKRRSRILQTLERYRNGVYQCGSIVGSKHIDMTHQAIEALERQLARIDQVIAAWEPQKPRSRSERC
jgi:hypothetical protein